MKVLELHFNPKAKKDVILDTFYYEPENSQEKKLGYLLLAGELNNVLPSHNRFLKNLAHFIKVRFYSFKENRPQACLKKTLKQTNQFLEKITKQGDVAWISNLNFAILNLYSEYKLSFTKHGDIEIFLARANKVLNIGKNLKIEEIEPYPLKIFFNIAFGKLEPEDKVLIMSKQVAQAFLNQGIIEKIGLLGHLDEKKLNQILNQVKKDITGICLLVSLEKKPQKQKEKRLIFKPKIAAYFPKIDFLTTFSKFNYPARLQAIIQGLLASWALIKKKKNLNLILTFIFLLILGWILGIIKENRQTGIIKQKLELAQEKIDQASALLILKKNEQANDLFLSALAQIKPFINTNGPLENEIIQINQDIEANLSDLNKMTIIQDPELIFEFGAKFTPQKIIVLNNKLYFFSPYFENIYELDNKKIKTITIQQKFNSAAVTHNAILFFSKPDQIFPFKNGNFEPIFSLSCEGLELAHPFSFKENLYFLDKKQGQIMKYPYFGGFQWGEPKKWSISPLGEQAAGPISVDGSIWALQQNNLINKYYAGRLQKTFEIKVFPFCEEPIKIWTSNILPYLYVLEPKQKRIIILDKPYTNELVKGKQAQIVKQYQSEKFDNLKDFAISQNGKAIYLLNGTKVYLVSFE